MNDITTSQDEAQSEAYQYFMRTDPDMREVLGPIVKVEDPVTGREMRQRPAKIAMIRGAKELKDVIVYLDPLPHIRQEKGADLRGWYSNKGDGSLQGKRERPCMTDAILTQPYGGACAVQCTFCYINAGGKGYRGSGLASVPLDYGAQVKRQLGLMRSAQAGYFSSFTDPFLPLEDYYHNTQDGATAFVEAGLPVFFLSRLAYPGWAYDLLTVNPHSYMQKSINTPHEDDWKKLSPGAISLEEHLAEIRAARQRGIYVSIQVNPVVPGIVTHDDVEHLFDLLADAGAHHVIVKFVEANHPWAPAMIAKIVKGFGDNRAAAFRELFVENGAGNQKTITWDYRREGHERYQAKATARGMTYATCYEYTKVQPKGYRSVGHDYLTGDTCHGHRVPFYTRKGPADPFLPLDECPPSGCLTCSDDNDGRPRCGSAILGAALALQLKDLRKDPFGAP